MVDTDFFFNGINSTTMGLYNVRIESGFIKSPVFGSREPIEDRNPRKDYTYHAGVKKSPIQLEITFSLLDGYWTDDNRFKIFQWLVKDDYCSFYTADKPNRIYYLLCTSAGDLMTNGLEQGYITMSFINKFPYTLSSVYTQTYDLSAITVPTIIQMTNYSNVNQYYYPEIEFELGSATTGISFKNLTVNSETLTFAGLTAGETVYVNNENRQITSNITGSYPINQCTSKQWLRLVYGINNIEVTGKCTLRTRMQYPLYV